jgi:hypothetical protein
MRQALAYMQNIEPVSSGSNMRLGVTFKPLGTTGNYIDPALIVDEFSEYVDYAVPDWDGYGANPITTETVAAARALKRLFISEVPPADIAPGADGTIGFEWRSGSATARTRIIFEVGPGDRLIARQIDPSGSEQAYPPTTVTSGGRAIVSQFFKP